MGKANLEIRGRYDFFISLRDEKKIVLENKIFLAPKSSNVRWLSGGSGMKHATMPDDIHFFVERSTRDSKYGIKLSCASLTAEPFFRFDSDGPAHRNAFQEIPLEDQSVSTPHFNSFREDGRPFAFKNDALKSDGNSKAIREDISFGISLFCMETRSELANGGFPEILDFDPRLPLSTFDEVNFDDINFR